MWKESYMGSLFSFPPYAARLALGVSLGLFWLWILGPRRGFSRHYLTPLLWSVALGALLGGRLGYLFLHPPYFTRHPLDALALREVGGLAGWGAWLGGSSAAVAHALRRGYDPTATLGILAPAALLVAAGGWWGCADAGCAWGREAFTAPPRWRWLVMEGSDLYHTFAPRYAVQRAEAVVALGAAALASSGRRAAFLAVAAYMATSALLTLLRGDGVPALHGWRLDALSHILLATLSVVGGLISWKFVKVESEPGGDVAPA